MDELPVQSFADVAALRSWLEREPLTSAGVWVRLSKPSSGVASISFQDLLVEGLAFGWSESQRRAADANSYLQRFTPRRRPGTVSARNEPTSTSRTTRLLERRDHETVRNPVTPLQESR